MRIASLIISLAVLTGCNGHFSAGYLVEADWDNYQQVNTQQEVKD